MKIFEGLKMSDDFYKYVVYKKELGYKVQVDAILTEDGELIAKEYEISETEKINMQIHNITKELYKTDYIANKLAEAIAEYIVTEDKTKLIELRTKYATELVDRESWRKEIDELQENLKNI